MSLVVGLVIGYAIARSIGLCGGGNSISGGGTGAHIDRITALEGKLPFSLTDGPDPGALNMIFA